jgi:hypothetical protein
LAAKFRKWQNAANFIVGRILPNMKLAAAELNFGRLQEGTRGKNTETQKNGSRTRLWQNSANFVTLAGFCQVREFGSRT